MVRKYFSMDKKNKQNSYPDTWGDIVLRNEAWIVFRNIKQLFKKELSENSNESYAASLVRDRMLIEFMNRDKIAYKNMHDYIALELEWERFFEAVSDKYLQTVFKEV